MDGEAKKLHLIEELLKIDNDAVLDEVAAVISRSRSLPAQARSYKDFAGMISDNEANELKDIIAHGCEQINPDDWK
ncbi:MAG: hypothetical protein V4649_09725 [Bacteroidota bacterium]